MIERDLFYYRIFIIIFWIEACFGFVSEELLPFEAVAALKSPLYFLFDIILFCLGLATISLKREKVFAWSFLIIAVISTLILNKESFVPFINGSRQFIGVIFFIPIFRYLFTCRRGNEFREKIDRHLFIFLCIQTVCVTEQFIRYGAGDHGGGSLGNGGSGVISTLICVLSFYFLIKKWDSDRYLLSLKENWKYIFLLFPVFLNETKVSFVFLFVYFLLLYKFEFKSIGKILIAAPVLAITALVFFGLYKTATNAGDDVASEEYMTEYLLSSDIDHLVEVAQMVQDGDIDPEGVWSIDLPRFAKLGLMPFILSETPGGNLFGVGLGQFKGGTTLGLTKFATKYQWFIQGSVPMMFFVMIQLGLVGLIWFIIVMFNHLNFKQRAHKNALKIKLFLTAIIAVCMLYNDMFQLAILCWPFFYVLATTSIPYNKTVVSDEHAQ